MRAWRRIIARTARPTVLTVGSVCAVAVLGPRTAVIALSVSRPLWRASTRLVAQAAGRRGRERLTRDLVRRVVDVRAIKGVCPHDAEYDEARPHEAPTAQGARRRGANLDACSLHVRTCYSY